MATDAPVPASNVGFGVPLDDFDSDNFPEALRRDRLFEPSSEDDLNLGEGDWLLALDSEAEGDEESILLGENDDDEIDEIDAMDAPVLPGDDQSDDSSAGGGGDHEVPVEFDLTDEELDDIQLDGWDTFNERESDHGAS
ncbi:hypothetical protein PHYPSEUDO_002775 [Phytophthora pseudosyringae]|uniref:Uncharacterized protein n=1 Tax=Phytophthora pseudosyringae TaxID=221518 RepID=A0A8T1VWM8_9STRA|nr:hypothetical protein PHYPSEUDO_002775 [Phytophthora pseudosyringae]